VLFDTIKHTIDGFDHRVVVLAKRGAYLSKLLALGISVDTLSPMVLLSLLRERKRYIVHSYLYHSHIASLIFRVLGGEIVWAVHSSLPPSEKSSVILKICCFLSYVIPKKIVYVSGVARHQHIDRGFTESRGELIHNGVDVELFQKSYRFAPSIDLQKPNIVMIARYHPIKDYDKFLSIVSEVLRIEPLFNFYLIGQGNTLENKSLESKMQRYDLAGRIKLLGEIDDIPSLLGQFDLLVSTSKSESFALTVLEALLSGVNVSTVNIPIMAELFEDENPNTGDVGDDVIAKIWIQKARSAPSDSLVQYARSYSLDRMARGYSNLYTKVL
jgi:glycosyltransferase involved in cell wall biosynthesis